MIKLFLLLLVSCSSPYQKYVTSKIHTCNQLTLPVLTIKNSNKIVNVFLEGDGMSFKNFKISPDPTPRSTTTLQLFETLKDSLYIARPCQFCFNHKCTNNLWSKDRYHPDNIKTIMQAIDLHVKPEEKINLIAFSGGAYNALIIASLRTNQVNQIITFAGNLDPSLLDAYHKTQPLNKYYEIDPHKLAHIKITNFFGGKDRIVPYNVMKHASKKFKLSKDHVIDNFTHNGPWHIILDKLSQEQY